MQTYLALTRLSIQRQFTYRAATLAGLATNFFFGILRAAVMVALYHATDSVEGMTLQDAITYTGLAQSSIAFLALFSWFEIIFSVNSGQVGADLLKPMSYFGFWMAQDFGRALVGFLLRGVGIMALYAMLIHISLPHSLGQWLAVVLSMLLAWLVSFAWRFLINLSAFWVTDARGLCRLFFGLSWFLCGFFMPLHFYPPWMQAVAYATPFPHMLQTFVDIYLGLLNGPQTVSALLSQAGWALALIIAGQITLRLGVRKLVIQGG